MSSDDSFEKKKAAQYDPKDDDLSDDVLSDMTPSENSEEEEARLKAQEEEELKKHRLAMAKREADKMNNTARSSKGFQLMKEKDTEKAMRTSFQVPKEEDGETCPYKSCGRKFASIDQLKNHIERRHKNEPPAEEKKISFKEVVNKQPDSFMSQKKISNKLGSIKMDKAESILSQSDVNETPVPQKSKAPPMKDPNRQMHTFEAKPKARPITSWGAGGRGGVQAPTSTEQQAILNDIMGSRARVIAARPQTAATSSMKDETRILNKLKVLEKIEQKIEEDLEEFLGRRGDKLKEQKKGLQITKEMLLDNGQSDTLAQVSTVILRDKNIEIFDSPLPGQPGHFQFDDLVNLECLYASHNLIKDMYGIAQITTLRELNLSFNLIQDIAPLEELVHLEKLFLNRNKISVIDPLKKLTSLNVLGLFHNEIFNAQKSLEIFAYLGINYKLRELSIDGNPISSTTRFKNQLLVSIPKLEMLDEERIQALDREVAVQYFKLNNIEPPCFHKSLKTETVQKQTFDDFLKDGATVDEEGNPIKNIVTKDPKKVKFSGAIDDDHEGDWQNQEIKKLQTTVSDLLAENTDLRKKLEKKNYDKVYKDNSRMTLELKNMYIIMEENKDLKEDLQRLKAISYDQKIKDITQENQDVRKRNGFLLITNDELQRKNKELNEQIQKLQLSQNIQVVQGEKPLQRPQTASVFGRKKEDLDMLLDDELLNNAQSQFDKELNELLAKNQQRLMEMQQDIREVSKITGESTVNVRKINNPGTKRVLKKSLQENQENSQIDSSSNKLKPIQQQSEDVEYI